MEPFDYGRCAYETFVADQPTAVTWGDLAEAERVTWRTVAQQVLANAGVSFAVPDISDTDA